MSGFFRTYLTFNVLARFHFSVSYSASVKGTVANSMLASLYFCFEITSLTLKCKDSETINV